MLLIYQNTQAQLPALQFPPDNPPNPEKIDLGYRLFFDNRLSVNGTISCATCHLPSRGFTDGRQIARGIFNRRGTRNSPTLVNSAYLTTFFLDGRASSLEGQALAPLTSPNEFGQQTLQNVINKIHSIKYYRERFAKCFPEDPRVTSTNLAKAIATFERTLISFNTPYDKYIAGDVTALSPRQQKGLNVFNNHCISCHTPPLLTDNNFHNTGTSPNTEDDQGRFTITQNRRDFKAFRTRQLREVARTNPYMHNGRFPTLNSVILFYNTSRNLNLSPDQIIALEDFLKFGLLSSDLPNIPIPVQYK